MAMGAAAAWSLTRDTPERVLASALHRFSQLPGANVQVSLFWDRRAPSGQGDVLDTWITYGGLIDVRDLEHIKAKGAIGYSKTQNAEDVQTANIVLNADTLSVQLATSSASLIAWFESASGTSTKDTWFSFQRDVLLKEKGFSAFMPLGRADDIRTAWNGAQFSSWASPESPKERMSAYGRSVVDANLTLNAEAIESALVSLQSAWMAKDPSPAMLDWASRVTSGLKAGKWSATYADDDVGIRSLRGTWPMVDGDGSVQGHVTLQVDVFGAATVQGDIPEGAIDLTPAIRPTASSGFAPAQDRAPSTSATSTEPSVASSTEPSPVQP